MWADSMRAGGSRVHGLALGWQRAECFPPAAPPPNPQPPTPLSTALHLLFNCGPEGVWWRETMRDVRGGSGLFSVGSLDSDEWGEAWINEWRNMVRADAWGVTEWFNERGNVDHKQWRNVAKYIHSTTALKYSRYWSFLIMWVLLIDHILLHCEYYYT